MKIHKIFKALLPLLLVAVFIADTAIASVPLKWDTKKGVMRQSYSDRYLRGPSYTKSNSDNGNHYGWLGKNDFRARVDKGTHWVSGKTREVRYFKNTKLLYARGFSFTKPYNFFLMSYNLKNKDVVVYHQARVHTYSKNGTYEFYYPYTKERIVKNVGKDVYLAKKAEMKKYVQSGLDLIANGGVITTGEKGNFQEALKMLGKK